MSGRENIWSEKCPVGEMSYWGYIRSGKCTGGEIFDWRNFLVRKRSAEKASDQESIGRGSVI